jgi:ribosomal-protein-alanine N-acetyltransferase
MLKLSFSPFPSLTTERLLLRQLIAEDADAVFSLRNNDTVNQYLSRPKATDRNEAVAFIEKITKSIANNESLYWVICLKEEQQLLGTICIWNIDKEKDTAEIGYELLPAFHGKGIMQEALTAVIDFGFNTLQLKTIAAYTVPGNIASSRLLEKNNFKLIGTAGEEVIYRLQR